jgi:uncharacterized OsmC-like protein
VEDQRQARYLEAEAKLKRIMAELSNLEGQSAKRRKAMGRIAARKRQIDNWMREEALRAIEIHEKGCPASQSVQRGITIEWDGEAREEE